MAAEFEHLTADFLSRLPQDSPDRPFLESLHQAVVAYTERVASDTVQAPWQALGDAMAATELDTGDRPAPGVAPPAPEEVPLTAEQDRVHLHGRLGAAPRFRTTPKGVKIGSFPLAVRGDGDTTTWYRILAFNNARRKNADKLEQLNLAKGAAVDVIGYRHAVARRGREGTLRTEEQVYAAAIKAR